MNKAWVVLPLLVAALAGCSGGGKAPASSCEHAPPLAVGKGLVAVFKTSEGDIHADLKVEEAPRTVANFVCLARAGFYDDTTFPRVIFSFMMQGGDPNTRNDDPNDDGRGGSGYAIADEFHRLLRFEGAGVLAMANAGPNTGGSQFFITFGSQHHLDDRHSIFGQVRAADLALIARIDKELATNGGKPRETIELHGIDIVDGTDPPTADGVSLWSPTDNHKIPANGGTSRFLVVVESRNPRRDQVTLAVAGNGITPALEPGFNNLVLAGRQRAAFVVSGNATPGGPLASTITVTATMGTAVSSLVLHIQRSDSVGPRVVVDGDYGTFNSVELSEDGRVVRTSIESVAQYADKNKLGFDQFRLGTHYAPYPARPGAGSSLIDGFSDIVLGTPEGATSAGRILPERAYGTTGECSQGESCLIGRVLLEEIEVVDLK